MILGITGSIGSGKTTAAKLFSKHHCNIISADEMAHNLIKNDSEIYKQIVNEFGKEVLGKNKNIDRKKLGKIVFNDENKLKKLNSIIHPLMTKNIKNKINEIKNKCGSKTKIIIDAPLLLETNAKELVDKIIVVNTDMDNVLKRNKKFSREQIERILKRQMPLEEKVRYADFVIDNNKDWKYLKKQVNNIIKKISSKA